MLEIILVWVYIFFTSFAVGGFLSDLVISRDEKHNLKGVYHAVLTSLAGLVVIMVVAGYMSLFLKTGWVINMLLSSFSLYYYFIRRKNFPHIRFSFKSNEFSLIIRNLFLFTALVLILVKSAGPINNPDTGAYHLPMVKWIENFNVIKGLANTHSRLGFNYQYELLCAVYGLAFIKGSTIHAMNGYFMLMIVFYLTCTLSFYQTKKLSSLDFIKLIALFFVVNMNNAISSLSPDFPTTVMVTMAILLVIEKLYDGSIYDFDKNGIFAFVLTTGAVLFKISAAPAFLFCLLFIIPLFKQNIKLIGILFISGIASLLPYLIRNYFISGYLVYPLYNLDIFDVPWKVGRDKILFEKDVIRYWALGVPYGQPLPEGKELFDSWIHYLRNANSAYIYLIIALGSSMLLSMGILVQKLLRKQYDYVLLFLFFYICLGYWWYNAPDPRFGNGFIVPFIGITLAIVMQFFIKNSPSLIVNGVLGILIALCGYMIRGKAVGNVPNSYNKTSYNFITPPPYPQPDTINLGTRINPSYYVLTSDTSWCWESCLPCSYRLDKYEYLGPKIEDGFKHANGEVKLPDSLKQIYFNK